jgi:hypothetical protein
MTTSFEAVPWRELPARVADLLEPALADVSAEILATIGREVPEYARPLEGRFGRGLRTGVEEALRQFVALIRSPDAGRPGREVYVELGRGELRQGRTLDALQAAYRVGARVAWRRFAEVGRDAGLDPEVLSLLAESIFAYIDELSADSVEGYAEAQSEADDRRRGRRRELLRLLMTRPAPPEADLRAAAQAAEWPLPERVAALACGEAKLPRLTRLLPADALGLVVEGGGCALVPDPEGPRRLRALEAEAGGGAVLGPAGPVAELPESWRLARAGLRALEAGAIDDGGGLVRIDEHLAELMLFESGPLLGRIAARRLAPLDALTEKARLRMRTTALAYIRHGGNAVAMAGSLHVHPQTARYRSARLRELLGEQLDDPEARFELELALRATEGG